MDIDYKFSTRLTNAELLHLFLPIFFYRWSREGAGKYVRGSNREGSNVSDPKRGDQKVFAAQRIECGDKI
mgnify:CR=1 FL=1